MKENTVKKHIIVETPPQKKPHRSRIEQHYTTIVSIFVGLSVVLIACILYFSFTKTVITVTSPASAATETFDIPLADVDGKIFLTDATASATQSNFSGNAQKPGKAGGTVTIVNKYSANQTLVATTRLLSTEKVLFRTTKTVVVPAGGSVTVDVIADAEGAAGDIPASHFEIVALWDGLKDKIYGTSSAAMTGGVVTQNVVTQNDIDTVTTEAEGNLTTVAQSLFDTELATRTDLPEHATHSDIAITTVTSTPSAHAGDTVGSLSVDSTGSAAIAVYDKEKLVSTVSQKITDSIPAGFALAESLNTDDIDVTLSMTDADPSTAVLSVSIPYTTTLSVDNAALDPNKLTSMSETRVRAYLASELHVETVTIEFSPFWLKLTPALADHIVVKIQ